MSCRPERWLLGLPSLLAIGAVAVWQAEPQIEGALQRSLARPEAAGTVRQLERLGIRLAIEGRDLSATAEAEPDAAARSGLAGVTGALPGLRRVLVRTEPSRLASPFVFSVARRGGTVLLGGSVPPGEARAQLNELAASRGPVQDGMRSALGAPDGFLDAAPALIRAVALLGNGASASLSDTALELHGEADDAPAYNEALALLRAVPAGFSRERVEITPPLARPYGWSAARHGERLVLRGYVPSEAERARLLELVRQAGLSPDDGMQTARGLPKGVEFGLLAERTVGALARLDSGTVELADGLLTVVGRGAARDLLPEVERDLRQWRHPGLELGQIAITAVPASPYRFSAVRREGRVTLSGYAPDDAERTELAALAGRRFPFSGVASQIRLADGVPPGFMPVARLALDRLANLAEGDVKLVDRTMQLSGRSPYPELAARLRREAQAGLPEGWTAAVDIAVGGGERALDPRFCEDLLNDAARREPIRFEAGRDDIGAAAAKGLAGVAEILRRCGPVKVTAAVSGAAAAGTDPPAELAKRRASAIAGSLSRLGTGAEVRAVERPGPAAGMPSDGVTFEVRP